MKFTCTLHRLCLCLSMALIAGCGSKTSGPETTSTVVIPATMEAGLAEREELDQSVWATEQQAQQYEAFVVDLWDQLRGSPDKLERLAATPLASLSVPLQAVASNDLGQGITLSDYGSGAVGTNNVYSSKDVKAMARTLRAQGFLLAQTEWHHQRFSVDAEEVAHSEISFTLFLDRPVSPHERVIVKGMVEVQWKAVGQPGDIRVRDMKLTRRSGTPGFLKVTEIDARKLNSPVLSVQPLITYDLNRDGLSEVILGGVNLVHWNQGGGSFSREPLLQHWPGEIGEAALMADFTGDHYVDFLCVTGRDRAPVLFPGNSTGKFVQPGRKAADIFLQNPSVITAGDIDGDGDLDLWVTQYRPPYLGGQMPTPYYDALDGFPSYLLLNDGAGTFRDVTEKRGLAERRNRRTYSSSFVDLDADQDLDLMVVSDFAGVDLYENDGAGTFRDVRSAWVKEWHNFGMGHTVDDFNRDGNLDFYVIGMSSTTARRLDAMNAVRDGFADHARLRGIMGYGNRMYLGGDQHAQKTVFAEPAFRQQVARTGWSWGTTSFDLENDGDPDLYVSNGHQSGRSSKDYCATFWCHDIYTGDSQNRPMIDNLLALAQADLRSGEISWNGFEKNVLLLNQQGKGFHDVGWLMNVAMVHDCRGVVSDDLNGDGLKDLLVVEEWSAADLRKGQVLHVFANTIETDNHWFAARLLEQGHPGHAAGATVKLTAGGRTHVQQVVNGDSFFSQHAPVLHFGLGQNEQIDLVEVSWQGGSKVFDKPKADQVLVVPLTVR